MVGEDLIAAVLGGTAGAMAGGGSRLLLARLRRGVVLRPGPLEMAGAIGGAITVALAWGSPLLVLAGWLALLLPTLSAVDLVHHRLPDAITLPAVPLTLVLILLTWWVAPASGSPVRAVLAAALVGGLFLGISLARPRAYGRGDAKLGFTVIAALGYLSWPAVLLGLLIAFSAGALVGLAGIALRRWNLAGSIAFGPYLLLGAWSVLLAAAVN